MCIFHCDGTATPTRCGCPQHLVPDALSGQITYIFPFRRPTAACAARVQGPGAHSIGRSCGAGGAVQRSQAPLRPKGSARRPMEGSRGRARPGKRLPSLQHRNRGCPLRPLRPRKPPLSPECPPKQWVLWLYSVHSSGYKEVHFLGVNEHMCIRGLRTAQIWEGPHTSGPRPCGGLWMARRRCGEAAATHPPTCLCACATAPGPFIPPDACGKAHAPWVCPAEMHGPCVPRNGSVLESPKDTAPQNTSGPTPHGPQRPFVFKATSQWTTELSSQVLVPHFSHGPNTFKGHVQRQQYDVYLQRDMSVHPTKGPLIAWAMNTDDCEHLCCGKNPFVTHATGLLDQQESA